jgi:hypothetical protein
MCHIKHQLPANIKVFNTECKHDGAEFKSELTNPTLNLNQPFRYYSPLPTNNNHIKLWTVFQCMLQLKQITDEDSHVLWSDHVSGGEMFATFRKNILPSASRFK